ncbi:hypothetical protein IFM89_001959, partial [Coptis chinensis]
MWPSYYELQTLDVPISLAKVADVDRVLAMKEYGTVGRDVDIGKGLQRLKELEEESSGLRMANSRLQGENSKLLKKLESTQVLATYVLELPEGIDGGADASPEDQERIDKTHRITLFLCFFKPIMEAKATTICLDKNYRPVRIPPKLQSKVVQYLCNEGLMCIYIRGSYIYCYLPQ